MCHRVVVSLCVHVQDTIENKSALTFMNFLKNRTIF